MRSCFYITLDSGFFLKSLDRDSQDRLLHKVIIEVTHPEGRTFKVNGYQLKHYFGEDLNNHPQVETTLHAK